MLSIKDLDVHYDDVQVLHGVTMEVRATEIVTIVGANGAGKTTLLKTITSIHRSSKGQIWFEGERIDHLSPHHIVDRGLIRIPEGRKIFPTMSVLENLELGSYLPKAKALRSESMGKVFDLFPRLRERTRQLAGTLSGGEQQMLAIGRGLMTLPRLLMLDEPSLGIAPLLVREIFRTIREVNHQGTTLLLVEQNVFNALDMAHRGYVLENGKIVLQGEAHDLLGNEYIKESYLGI
ncbi:MAG: ABC transporter ATP-binding protein [Thermodesulfobacteriota bacterium]|nr:ABC transporter ATP-binding protein [Thermodesulfobacteriota bacterium]